MALPSRRLDAESSVEEHTDKFDKQFDRLHADFCRIDAKVDAVRDQVVESERALRSDFKAEMAQLRTDFRADMTQLRSDFREDSSKLRGEVSELRGDFKTLPKTGIGACVFFLSLFGAGYYRLDEKMEKSTSALQESMSALQVTVARIARAHGIPDSSEAPAERKPDPSAQGE